MQGGLIDDDDADLRQLSGGSPRLRAPGSSAFDARTMSPTMRTVHPKARRTLDVDMPESMEPIFGRGSPNPFQPIRGGSDLGHRDTAIALARAGYVAAALLHPRNNYLQ